MSYTVTRYSHFLLKCIKHKCLCPVDFPELGLFHQDDGQITLQYQPKYSITLKTAEQRFSRFYPSHDFVITPRMANQTQKDVSHTNEIRSKNSRNSPERKSKRLEQRSNSRSRSRPQPSRTAQNEAHSTAIKNRAKKGRDLNVKDEIKSLKKMYDSMHFRQQAYEERLGLYEQKVVGFEEQFESYGEEIEVCKLKLETHSGQIRSCHDGLALARKMVERMQQDTKNNRLEMAKQDRNLREILERFRATSSRGPNSREI